MKRPKFLTPEQAVELIPDGANVAVGGFVGSGHPEALTCALEQRFLKTQSPRGLTVIYAAGQGDGATRGLNHLGYAGLVKRVIGGHWNLAPRLGKLAVANEIEAYNFPQGVICKLFREIASGNPGLLSRIGIGTFVDPRVSGGRLNARTIEDLVEVVQIGGEEMLFFHSLPIDVGLVRGTYSDSMGNISMEREPIIGEGLSIAQAAHNHGGLVIAQVEEIVADEQRDPKSIRLPGILVDAVVVAPAGQHAQTFACEFNDEFVQSGSLSAVGHDELKGGPRRWIAARCLDELREGDVVNLGIGIAEGVAQLAYEKKMLDRVVLTVEAGAIGGVPVGGLSFGCARYPMAIIDQPSMFDFYDGGGLDIAFLSMAECDAEGNVNVSKYGGRIPGSGGFINIAQTAKRVVFVGTFLAGTSEMSFSASCLRIQKEGSARKFVPHVEQITFSARQARASHRDVLYVTERAVFRMVEDGLELIEIAPGIDLRRDVLAHMGFHPRVSNSLREMQERIFL